jgi:N-methylhydantoinase B
MNPGTPAAQELPAKCTLTLKRGDVFRHVFAGPGGWGDPMTRDPERVRWDVLEEKITVEYARREYGVVLDPATLEILVAETARLRAAR